MIKRPWILAIFYSATLWSAPIAAANPAITQPRILLQLESNGLDFATIMTGKPAANNAGLIRHPGYASIVNDISRDLDHLASTDPKLSITMAGAHRLFDKRWLSSSKATFELTGVVNRQDRQVFAASSCGEIRLLYRLGYHDRQTGAPIQSRLPFTVNVVYWAGPGDDPNRCEAIARRWKFPKQPPSPLALWLVSENGPLHKSRLSRLKSVEINMQAVRWPSTVRPDMAGYAEYLLRVFKPTGDVFRPSPLENTPDVARLNADPRLKRALLSWLRHPDNIDAIDRGTVNIPEEFLAFKTRSFALHGIKRLANRPFDRLYRPRDFQTVDFSRGKYVKSPYALLRRLNDMSCAGCHQNRSIAGFHFLGVDRGQTSTVNFIHTPGSPHFTSDQPRRRAFLQALLQNKPPDHERGFSDRTGSDGGGFGDHCVMDAARTPSFAAWQCKRPYLCRRIDTPRNDAIGQCLPPRPTAGSPCRVGRLTQSADPLRDRIVGKKSLKCGHQRVCETTNVGFPGGMCSSSCERLQPGETCGSIALLSGFNRCLGERKPFDRCLRNHVRPAALRACDTAHPCRDDYICTRTASGDGACIPPYFLFQLRVDGHVKP